MSLNSSRSPVQLPASLIQGQTQHCGPSAHHFLLHVVGLERKTGKGRRGARRFPHRADRFHHCAFELRDIHEVFGGGLRMNELGWKTHLGPGRHNVTSAYYWYFRSPSGGAAEYGFDTDRLDDNWEPRMIEPTNGAFAEWSLEEGMGRFAGLQRGVKPPEAA